MKTFAVLIMLLVATGAGAQSTLNDVVDNTVFVRWCDMKGNCWLGDRQVKWATEWQKELYPWTSSNCIYSEGGSLLNGGESCWGYTDANGKAITEGCKPCDSKQNPLVKASGTPAYLYSDAKNKTISTDEIIFILERARKIADDRIDCVNSPCSGSKVIEESFQLKRDIDSMIKRLN
jgi:hypothetical protein